jgi:DNA repair exonuclease SbcCD ATPase subunit
MTLTSKLIRPMTLTLVLAGLFAIGACESRNEKAEADRGELQDERENVAEQQRELQEAEQDLTEAQRQARVEWQQDYLSFKREMVQELTDNEKLILEKREKAATLDSQEQARYNTAIAEAERRNNELRDQLNNAPDQGADAWTQTKEQFRMAVNQVEDSIKNLDATDTGDAGNNGNQNG